MEIEVSGYDLETEFMSASAGFDPRDESVFNVWLKFRDSKDLAVVSFGIQIPAKEYTPEEFREAVREEAQESIRNMERKQAEDRAKREVMDGRKRDLEDLGPRVAGAAGVEWFPPGRSR